MFATNLKRLREEKKLTYRELAEDLNKKYDVKFSKSTIQRWEENTSSPSIAHATALAHYFNVSLDDLTKNEAKHEKTEEENNIETLAAHIDGGVTDEEMKEILAFIKGIKASKK